MILSTSMLTKIVQEYNIRTAYYIEHFNGGLVIILMKKHNAMYKIKCCLIQFQKGIQGAHT